MLDQPTNWISHPDSRAASMATKVLKNRRILVMLKKQILCQHCLKKSSTQNRQTILRSLIKFRWKFHSWPCKRYLAKQLATKSTEDIHNWQLQIVFSVCNRIFKLSWKYLFTIQTRRAAGQQMLTSSSCLLDGWLICISKPQSHPLHVYGLCDW